MQFYFLSKYLLILLFVASFTPSFSQRKVTVNPEREQKRADSLYTLGDWGNALPIYSLLKKEKPQQASNWFSSGSCLQNLREYDKALLDWTRYLQVKPIPDSVFAQSLYVGLSKIYGSKNDVEKGIDYLILATHFDYNNLNEMDYDPDFSSLRFSKKFIDVRNKVQKNAFPCLYNSKAREFDFLVGDWDTYSTGTGKLIGSNKVEHASAGCLIMQSWISIESPQVAKSMNYYDPLNERWEQNFIGSDGSKHLVQRMTGHYYPERKSMQFDYTVKGRNGKLIIGRYQFISTASDSVKELNEASFDDGKTWQVRYDNTHIRKRIN